MPRLGDTPEGHVMKREFSPDRRLALDWLPYGDPRNEHEWREAEAIELRDAETGALLGHFGGWARIEAHDWPAGGGVALRLHGDAHVRIAPDLATFTTGGMTEPRPIAELPDCLRSLFPPLPRAPGPIERMAPLLILVALIALGVFALSRVSAIRETFADLASTGQEEKGTGDLTGWLVRCEDIGIAPMSLQPDGRLRVPEKIAPAPLPPLDGSGRRFGDGRVVVELDGIHARWWPRGAAGPMVPCPSTSRAGG